MNQSGDGAVVSGPSTSPFKGLSLSVDAYTLDTAGGKRRLRTVKDDGSLEYETPIAAHNSRSPRNKRTTAVKRIWDEVPGQFHDVNEAALRDADPDKVWSRELDVEEKDDTEKEAGELMSKDDMAKLRGDVVMKLAEAQNQLWLLMDLARCLKTSADIKSDPPPEPLPTTKKSKAPARAPAAVVGPESIDLPAGAMSTTVATARIRSTAAEAQALENAIAIKAAALDDCSALIDAAVDELRLMNSAAERWAGAVRDLHVGNVKGGQWAVIPKPNFNRTAEKTAKDVVIPYALDEAPPPIRMKSLAAFDLDPRKHELVFAERTYRRLRVRLRRGGPGGPQEGSLIHDSSDEEDDPATLLSAAQLETLDADLFNELGAEALALHIEAAVVEPTNVMLAFGQEKLIFQLYDTREKPTPTVPHSPVCDALLAAGRLGLLQAYKKRKEHIVATGSALAPGVSAPPPPPSPILVPIVQALQFRATCRAVRQVLSTLVTTLASAGLSAYVVERHAISDGVDVVLALLTARCKLDVLGAVFTIEVTGCRGLSVNITAPTQCTVVTPRASFPLRDVDSLAGIIRETMTEQLAAFSYPVVQDAAGAEGGVFFDELDGVTVAGHHGPVSITIPHPPDRLLATTGDGVSFDSSSSSQSFEKWLAELGKDAASAVDN